MVTRRIAGSSVGGLSVFQRDGDELVIVRVRGFIGHMIEHILEHETILGLEEFMLPSDGDVVDEPGVEAVASAH